MYGQQVPFKRSGQVYRKEHISLNDSTYLSVTGAGGACKSGNLLFGFTGVQSGLAEKADPSGTVVPAKQAGLPVHGDITYDFFYRSAIDTPFADNNIQQHNIRANIYLLIAKKLPVSLQVNTRQTNSRFFKNYTDLNFQFNGQAYNNAVKDQLAAQMIQRLKARFADSILLNAVQRQQALQDSGGRWLQEAKQLQQVVESRQVLAMAAQRINGEREELETKAGQDTSVAKLMKLSNEAKQLGAVKSLSKDVVGQSINNYLLKQKDYLQHRVIDSLAAKKGEAAAFLEMYEARKAQYEKGKATLAGLQQQYNSARDSIDQKKAAIKTSLASGAKTEINKKVKEYGLDSSTLYKWYRRVSAVEHFSIGRSMVDYSELSAKNISVNGIQAAYSNTFSVAVASGAIDYRYRDFIVKNYTPVKQYLNLVRIGIGTKESSNLFLSFYQGKKQANFVTLANQPAVNKVLGITLEGRFRLNDNNYLLAELGKSSYPQSPVSNTGITPANGKTFNFSNHSNEAYSLQLFSRIVKTDTKIYAHYKHLGRNFQSFSVFNMNSDFTAWQLRADQYLFKKKLVLTAGLRTSDYSNPYVSNSFKTNTVFKSLQATLRLKKWPVLSAGYMPSSQVSSLNNQLIENHFYTLMATANYVYRIRRGYMHSGLVYTRFYNAAPDTGFIYYNARNWFVYHNITGNVLSYNSAATFSYNSNYRLLTLDQGISCKVSSGLSAGGGAKWNRLNSGESHIGYYGNLQFRLVKLGELNLSFDRGYIPGITEKLRRNDFGRVTYIKTF